MTEPAVSPEMTETIQAQLDAIEAEDNCKILLAVESGSRAWGFHSPDSDYDVRFIYARPVDWHLRLGKKRDVIERPIDDELDVSGWDLGKALGLALKSNAVVAEWLQSPIVYRAHPEAVAALTEFCRKALSRRPVTWHYLSLLERQQSRLTGPGGGVRLKRYFYCLRPALALRWMRLAGEGMPPMDMAALRMGCALSDGIAAEIKALTRRKMALSERGEEGASSPILDALIEEERLAAKAWLEASPTGQPDPALWQEAEALHIAQVRALG